MQELKYIFLLALLFGSLGKTNAQIPLVTENFETTGPNCGNQAFLQGCFPDWINTHGSAEILQSTPASPSFNGNQHVKMYVDVRGICFNSGIDRGEGIALNFQFEAGVCYSLSYAIKGKAHNTAWILTDGLPNNGDLITTCLGNDIVPSIPSGSFIIPETSGELVSPDDWTWVNHVSFTPNTNYSQLWFRASNLEAPCALPMAEIFLDLVRIQTCCEISESCDITTDLTACLSAEDYGSIAMECEGTYDWDFPAGSTATELTAYGQSLVVNASPGTYTVTVTDKPGCTAIHKFVVEEDCCEPEVNCAAPTNPACLLDGQGNNYALTWDPVPGVQNYIITFVPNDSSCDCLVPSPNPGPFSVQSNAPPYFFTFSPNFKCYSWSVQAVCDGFPYSEPSTSVCVNKYGCN